jgi:MoxR-like ATPase
VHVDIKVRQYLMQLVHETRDHEDIALGASPRASLALFRAGQAMAAVLGRSFVLPDDVKRVAPAILTHRLIVRPESRLRNVTAGAVVEEILGQIPVPTLAAETRVS